MIPAKHDSDADSHRTYYLHKKKLRDVSDYFYNAFYELDGEGNETNQINLNDDPDCDFDGLEDAFEGFVEYVYRGDYDSDFEPGSEVLDESVKSGEKCVYHAKMIVLACKLIAEELANMAIENLREEWLAQRPDVENAVQVIRIIYEQIEQPRGELTGTSLPHSFIFPAAIECEHSVEAPAIWEGTTEIYCDASECKKKAYKKLVEKHNGVSGYFNGRARKTVATLAANGLEWLRNYKVFREFVQEGGPFVSDLLMEELVVLRSPLVEIIGL